MEIFGYFASLLIGVSLGVIGGGGSILTVPVLTYLFGVVPTLATAYSLFIVGVSSLVGAYSKYKKNLIDFQTAFIFGIPSIIAVFLTRKYFIPFLPDVFFRVGYFVLTKNIFLMVLFAVLMIFAAYSMIKDDTKQKEEEQDEDKKRVFNYPLIMIEGLVVGVLTGLVGAGGGFLIIPALVMLSKLSMKKAIGTSLIIIALKSLIGFLGDVSNITIQWNFLFLVTTIAVIGIFIGDFLSNKISGTKLKKGFGWFVLLMGIFVILYETSGLKLK
jgi:uncharacterized membrane protein YfcA